MATFIWSALASGSIINWDLATDVLQFDGGFSARDLQMEEFGPNLVLRFGGKTVELAGFGTENITTGNFVFADGSVILVGDNSTGTANDDFGNGLLSGSAGNDVLAGLGGSETMAGGAGDDVYYYEAGVDGADVVHDTAGTDILYLLFPEDGADVVGASRQTPGAPATGTGIQIDFSDGGSVYLDGHYSGLPIEVLVAYDEGDDTGAQFLIATDLTATFGNDMIVGTDGADTINGGAGQDLLFGSVGSDSLLGGDHDDNLWGGAGQDTLIGNDGDDILEGGADGDTLRGGAGSDEIFGGGGDDRIDGAFAGEPDAADTLYGGSGTDRIRIFDGAHLGAGDAISGTGDDGADPGTTDRIQLVGAGTYDFSAATVGFIDRIDISGITHFESPDFTTPAGRATGNVSVWLTNAMVMTADINGDGMLGDLGIIGYDFYDTLDGPYSGNAFINAGAVGSGGRIIVDGAGFAGNDTMVGGAGADALNGGVGGDRLFGNAGQDVLSGGAGDDRIEGGGDADTVYGGTGTDRIRLLNGGDLAPGEVLSGTDGATADASTTDRLQLINAGTYDFTGIDVTFIDRIDISGATDTASGAAGGAVSVILTDAMASTADFNGDGTLGDLGILGYDFHDSLSGPYTGNLFLNGSTLGATRSLSVLGDTDTVNHGGLGLFGGLQGHDTIAGGAGADTLRGGAGGDRLFGNAGQDVLSGGTGDDRVEGGAGADTVYGGAGGDRLRLLNGSELVSGEVLSGTDGASADASTTDRLQLINAGTYDFTGIDVSYIDRIDVSGATDTVPGAAGGSVSVTLTDAMAATADFNGDGTLGDLAIVGYDFWALVDGPYTGDLALDGSALGTTRNLLVYGDTDSIDHGPGLFGGLQGDDTITGGAGSDCLRGGAGDDSIAGGDGSDLIDGGSGTADRAVFSGNYANYTVIDIGGGSYTVSDGVGAGGIDTVSGVEQLVFADQTVIFGGGGGGSSDSPTGGNDTLTGSAGNDTIDALGGHDSVAGLAGDDSLIGGAGSDSLDGGTGNDRLFGGDGNDLMYGGDGDDRLDPGTGSDTLAGGAGTDRLRLFTAADLSAADLFTGTDGLGGSTTETDRIQIFGTGNYDFALPSISYFDRLDIAAASGSINVTLTGALASTADANGNGIFGDVAVFGYDGSSPDMNPPATTADVLVDASAFSGSQQLLVIGNSGTGYGFGGLNGNDTFIGGASSDEIAGGEGNDSLAGNGANDLLQGNGGNDTISGGDGSDMLDGGAANDTISGGNGNDTLWGGAGDDCLSGGLGDDIYVASWADGTDLIVDAGGSDTLELFVTGLEDIANAQRSGDDIAFTFIGLNSLAIAGQAATGTVETLSLNANGQLLTLAWHGQTSGTVADNGVANWFVLTGGDDALDASDGSGESAAADAALVFGGAGNDTLHDTRGNDTLHGGVGNDLLVGGVGNDLLIGGAGSDTLDVGPGLNVQSGSDTLLGGHDGDLYRYEVTNVGNLVTSVVTDTGTSGTDTLQLTFAQSWRPATHLGDIVRTGDQGQDMLVPAGVGHSILVTGQFAGQGVEVLRFHIPELAETIDYLFSAAPTGTAGNDFLFAEVSDPETGTGSWIDGGDAEDLIVGYDARDSLFGDGGDDVLFGNGGDDNLWGADGGDVLFGGDGADGLSGETGDDVLYGGAGLNELFGGIGNDTIAGGTGSDSAYGGDGDDSIILYSGSNLGYGGDGNDHIFGGGLLYGDSGNDSLSGLGGNDTLFGGAGVDTLRGGAGNDSLSGEADGDSLVGEDGNDTLSGGDGDDTLSGGDQADQVFGGGGDDRIEGGFGVDSLYGGDGTDRIRILNGTHLQSGDVISGTDGLGPDSLSVDRIQLINAGTFNFTGTTVSYIDRIDVSGVNGGSAPGNAVGSVTLTLTDAMASTADANGDGVLGDLRLVGYDFYDPAMNPAAYAGSLSLDASALGAARSLIVDGDGAQAFGGLDGDDTLSSGAGSDILRAGAGADHALGNGGADSIEGGAGDDTLDGGAGSDSIVGGAGNDRAVFSGNRDGYTIVNLGGGAFTVEHDGSGDTDTLTGVEILVFDDQNVTLPGGSTPSEGDDSLTGTEGADSLNALGGNDTIIGLGGDDTLRGGGGDDSIEGGDGNDLIVTDDAMGNVWGNDTVYGGAGNDTVSDWLGANLIYGGDGDDSLHGAIGLGLDTLYGGAGNDFISGLDGADLIYGGTGNDTIMAGDQNNTVFGEAGADNIFGGLHDDSLSGMEDNDTLWGADGNDTLSGGDGNDSIFGDDSWTGNDHLFGGAGNDRIATGGGTDNVLGGDGSDTIVLALAADLSSGDTLTGTNGLDPEQATTDWLYLMGTGNWDLGTGTLSHFDRVAIGASSGTVNVTLPGALATTADAGLDGAFGDLFVHGFDGGSVLPTPPATTANVLIDASGFGSGQHLRVLGNPGSELGGFDGNDTVYGGAGGDEISGGAGADSLFGNGGADTVVGGSGADYLYGDAGADLISGEDGDDSAYGGSENDTLSGGAGNDQVYGDAGNDRLNGGTGNDFLYGGDGDDELYGEEGDNALWGGAGSDSLYATLGTAVLWGEDGNDSLYGGANADTLIGGAGADRAMGGNGGDLFLIHNGSDLVAGDTIDAATGSTGEAGTTDRLVLVNNGTFDLTGASVTEIDRVDLSGSTSVGGGNANGAATLILTDAMVGTADFNGDGNLGDLAIFGLDFYASSAATTGNMTIDGSAVGATRALHVLGDSDTVNHAALGTFGGLQGNDTVLGGAGADSIRGGAGADSLSGNGGADSLFGGAGHDVLAGGDGNDSLYGNAGNDTVYGGAGTDVTHFTGNRSAYTLTAITGGLRVTHNSGGADGVDDLFGVETLQFADQALNIATTVSVSGPSPVAEGNASGNALTFTVSLSGASGAPVTVDFATSGNTAITGADFFGRTGTLTFAPGETSRTVSVWTRPDLTTEGTETFSLYLSAVGGGATLGTPSATGTITNDDVNVTPVATAPNISRGPRKTLPATDLFSLSDPNGDAVTMYDFWDGTAGSLTGYWTVNGVQQAAGQSIQVAPGNLSNVSFVTGVGGYTDTLYVRAHDGIAWGAWEDWTVAAGNAPPVATAPDVTVGFGRNVAISQFFNVTDAQSDTITQYRFWDGTGAAGSATVRINGVAQAAGQNITVNAADLGTVTIQAANGVINDQMWVQAFDGLAWGAWDSFLVQSRNTAPVVTATAPMQYAGWGKTIAASTLFGVSDADGQAITQYEFWDGVAAAHSGAFFVNGVQQAANTGIVVAAGNLDQVEFRTATQQVSETLYVRAYDGYAWSAWAQWTQAQINTGPVVTAADRPAAGADKTFAATSLFSATDAQGDTMPVFQFFDDTVGNGSFRLNGVVQAADTTIQVNAAQLAQLNFTTGAAGTSDLLWVRVSDGTTFGEWKSFTVTANNTAPVLTGHATRMLVGAEVAASQLFSWTDAQQDGIGIYQFWDDSGVAGSAGFHRNGTLQGAGVGINVAAGDIAQMTVRANTTGGTTDALWLRLSDGQAFSGWVNFAVQSVSGNTLAGTAGNDLLVGNGGANWLAGAAGNDTLVGGGDADWFTVGQGQDVIADFARGDVIDLQTAEVPSSKALFLDMASQQGADAVFNLGGGNSLTLLGVNLDDLVSSDFLL